MKKLIKNSFFSSLIFSTTLIVVWLTYWAISTVENWTLITANMWNELVTNINNLNDSVSWLTTNITSINTNLSQITNNWANKIKINIWSALQNSSLIVYNRLWTSIPWVTNTFSLSSSKTIKMRAYWTITPTSGQTYDYAHCWFRFVVDWTAYWDSTWWDQLIWCANGNKAVWWWCPWWIERELNLWAWTHTVLVQMTWWGTSYPWCNSDVQDFSKAKLFIEAW